MEHYKGVLSVGDELQLFRSDGGVISTSAIVISVEGDKSAVVRRDGMEYDSWHIFRKSDSSWGGDCANGYIINNSRSKSHKNMNIREKYALIRKGEPEKSFFKAGVTDKEDTLTTEGQAIFLGWLLKKHGPEFKTEVVDPLLADEETGVE